MRQLPSRRSLSTVCSSSSGSRLLARRGLPDLYDGGFPFSTLLRGHGSCVNATCWSHGDVQWLATGGDDQRVVLWNMHKDDVSEPTVAMPGSTGNIFTLAFSASNTHIISGGTDETVRRFDISRIPDFHDFRAFDVQQATICDISNHPAHDELFLSASEDGSVVLYDSRLPATGHAGEINTNAEFSGCQYHPLLHDLFITTDSRGRCYLRDARMAFAGTPSGNAGDARGIVRQYVTTLSRRCEPHLANPEASSVVFDSAGEKFAVIFSSFFPTIYTLADEYPIAVCTGRNDIDGTPLAPGVRTYENCCTIKHGSFGGPGDAYFATGSDDFRGYVWRIPDATDCLTTRRELTIGAWQDEDGSSVGFAKSVRGPRVLPVRLDTPAFRLCGHDSLINSVLLHPHAPLAVTSGVESYLRVHSPVATSGFERTDTTVRAVPEFSTSRQALFLRALAQEETALANSILSGDEGVVAFFDEVLRRESGNVFPARSCRHRPVDGDESDSDSNSNSSGTSE